MRITVLVENATPSSRLAARHGLALWIEAAGRRVLFDVGPDGSALANAAALGVEARRSAAKSQMVKSVSWPTAEITGIREDATAQATGSSLKAQRSSKEPPPRPMIITSTLSMRFIRARASTNWGAAPSPCTSTGQKTISAIGQRRPKIRQMS